MSSTPDTPDQEGATIVAMRTLIEVEGAAIVSLEVDDRIVSIDAVQGQRYAVGVVLGKDMRGYIVEFEVVNHIERIAFRDMADPEQYRKV